jgi:hypothetical protein
MTSTLTRFGQYHHLRTLSPRNPDDKIQGTITVGLSKPSPRWEKTGVEPTIELRTFWDAQRHTLVTQALPLIAHERLIGERYIDTQGRLHQTVSDQLPRETQIRLLQDIQRQESEHYWRTNRFGFITPIQRWFQANFSLK